MVFLLPLGIGISYFKDEGESKLGNYQKDLLRYVFGIRKLLIHQTTILHSTFLVHGRVIYNNGNGGRHNTGFSSGQDFVCEHLKQHVINEKSTREMKL